MKDDFAKAAQTPTQKRKALQAEADAIDKRLNTPQSPQMHLRPDGQKRRGGDELGRQAAKERSADLRKEIASLEKSMGPKQDHGGRGPDYAL